MPSKWIAHAPGMLLYLCLLWLLATAAAHVELNALDRAYLVLGSVLTLRMVISVGEKRRSDAEDRLERYLRDLHLNYQNDQINEFRRRQPLIYW